MALRISRNRVANAFPVHPRCKRGRVRELADKVDSTSITIGRYERDEVKPPLEAAAKIAAALGVSLDYLAGLTDNQVDAATLNKIIEIQALPEADRKHIMTTIDALLRDAKVRSAHK